MDSAVQEQVLAVVAGWVKDGRIFQQGGVRIYKPEGRVELRGTGAAVAWLRDQRGIGKAGEAETIESKINRYLQKELGFARGGGKSRTRVKSGSRRIPIAWPIPAGSKYVIAYDEPKFR